MKKLFTILLTLCVAMVLTLVIGGTLAYLQDVSGEKVNTFEKSTISVDLTEEGDGEYKIIPGRTDEKDPIVHVYTPDTDAWCIVKITDETEGLVSWELADGWTEIEVGGEKYIYRVVDQSDEVQDFHIIKDGTVSYDPAITVGDMGNLDVDAQLTFKAYVIQKDAIGGIDNIEDAIAALVDLPSCVFEELNENPTVTDTISADWTGPLDVTAQFATEDTLADIADKDYKDWIVDFAISFDKDITDTSKVHLFGQYDDWSDDWYGDDIKQFGIDTLPAGKQVKVVHSMMDVMGGSDQSYNDVVDYVKTFKCGLAVEEGALGEGVSLSGLTVNLALVMIDNDGHTHIVESFTHTYP